MSLFEKTKIELLKKKINLIIEKAKQEGRFSLFMANFVQKKFKECNTYKGFKYFFDLIDTWDKECKIPYQIGMQIDNLANENIIMINRTKLSSESPFNDENLFNIMNEGLINYGHENDAGVAIADQGIPSMTLASTPLIGLEGYINLLSKFRGSNSVILMKFSKEDLNEDGRVVDESVYNKIYYKKDGEKDYRIRPEYMLGVYLIDDSGIFEYYSKDQVLNNNNDIKTI